MLEAFVTEQDRMGSHPCAPARIGFMNFFESLTLFIGQGLYKFGGDSHGGYLPENFCFATYLQHLRPESE
jgi:hypothetical protein